ncbi:HAD family hydrolase [Clostridium sp. SHJSY1]|uniref:HAD family hydrolase n=1 Tax=Clostridium sp. SHJSY1 TaxID=2942483 RepID=UPI002876ED87|nr:HAD family hydrolase [Clostridium sp. SHJSY1]MDS0527992.1 HAD family hydrolase [Clostridium sp. SHJSY1]
MKLDSIGFDLDGTLWNSIEGVCVSWNEAISEYPEIEKELSYEDIKGCMGLVIKEIGEKLFPDLDEAIRIDLMRECCEREESYLEEHGGELFSMLEETLKVLSKKYKLYIVSNCQRGYIECFFRAHRLGEYFVDIECSGNTGLSKGENIKAVMERNNFKNSIYLGDTKGDFEGAKLAGIPFVYARYGFGDVEGYDYVIDKFEDILKIVE